MKTIVAIELLKKSSCKVSEVPTPVRFYNYQFEEIKNISQEYNVSMSVVIRTLLDMGLSEYNSIPL